MYYQLKCWVIFGLFPTGKLLLILRGNPAFGFAQPFFGKVKLFGCFFAFICMGKVPGLRPNSCTKALLINPNAPAHSLIRAGVRFVGPNKCHSRHFGNLVCHCYSSCAVSSMAHAFSASSSTSPFSITKHGMPILGDATYGNFAANKKIRSMSKINRLFLHCACTELEAEISGKKVVFSAAAKLPESFEAIMQKQKI